MTLKRLKLLNRHHNGCLLILSFLLEMTEEQPHSRIDSPTFLQHSNLEHASRRQKIISLLRKSSHVKRTFKIVNEIIPLIQEEPIFQPLANNFRVLSEVAQKIEHVYFHKNTIVYEERDLADYFYILLSGTVHLTVREYLDLPQTSEQQVEVQPEVDQLGSFVEMGRPQRKAVTEPAIADRFLQARIVRIIEQGGCFGEIMQEGSQRQTNAFAVDTCSALRINRKTYQILLKAQLKTEHYSRYLFLEQIPLFKQISSFSLSRICLLMNEQSKLYGQPLFKTGDHVTKLYVVRSGCFKLLQRIGRYSLAGIGSRIEHKIVNQSKKAAEYLIVQAAEILGDAEILEMQSKYQESCICQTQEASVLAIDKKLFLKIVLEDGSMDALKAAIGQKLKWKNGVAHSFLQRRTRNSVMNVYLNDQRHSLSGPSKKEDASRAALQQSIRKQDFFYNSLNRTLITTQNKHRFSVSKQRCRTGSSGSKNLLAIRTKKRQGVPHGIEDIVKLVKQKVNFEKRFRNQKKIKYLFKLKEEDAPLYIKCRFNRLEKK